jgi:Flp pilus assembly pilin Flp
MVSILLGGFLGVLWSGRCAARGFVINESETRSVPWTRILQRLGTGVIIGLLVAVAFWLDLSPTWKPSPFPQLWWLSFGLWNILLQHLLEKNITTDRSRQATIWQHFVRTVKSSGIGYGLLTGLSFALISGTVFALIYGLIYGPIAGLASRSILGPVVRLFYGLNYGLIGGLTVGPILGPILGPNSGFLSALLMGKGAMVQPVDRLIWSWGSLERKLFSKRHLRQAIVVGLALGLSSLPYSLHSSLPKFNLANALGAGLIYGLVVGFISWLLIGLLQGVSSATIENQRRVVPNQGIHRSAFNGIVLGLISAVVVGLIKLLSEWLSNTLTGASNAALPAAGLFEGLFAGLVIGLLNGGLTCLRHYVLRFLLWNGGVIPWNYPQFLDYAAEQILLRKVGGGYIFLHRLLLDYFANLELELGSTASAGSNQEILT